MLRTLVHEKQGVLIACVMSDDQRQFMNKTQWSVCVCASYNELAYSTAHCARQPQKTSN